MQSSFDQEKMDSFVRPSSPAKFIGRQGAPRLVAQGRSRIIAVSDASLEGNSQIGDSAGVDVVCVGANSDIFFARRLPRELKIDMYSASASP